MTTDNNLSNNLRILKLIQDFKDDFIHYSSKALKLVTNSGELVPFKLNAQQKIVHDIIEKQRAETGRVRVIILKSRKLGISTYTAGRFTWLTSLNKHKRATVITHIGSSTTALFRIYKRFYEHIPGLIKPALKKNNSKDFEFDAIDSSITVTTAGGSGEQGRGDTPHYLHASEIAFWPNQYEIAAGLMSSIADVDGTEIIIESTPDGIGNIFYDYWMAAKAGDSEYIPIFLPWTVDPACTRKIPPNFEMAEEEELYAKLWNLSPEQTYWRRFKLKSISPEKFRSEYPISEAEAFRGVDSDAFINPNLVLKARKTTVPEQPNMPLVIGVDVARHGKDKTCIVWRRGRTVSKYQLIKNNTGVDIANILIPIITKEHPVRVFVDGTGGYGSAVVDCLRLLGYMTGIVEINFTSNAIDKDTYFNKRAEIYGELKQWLTEEVSLPDEDMIEQDLTCFNFKHNGGRLQLESKDEVKKRLKRSPDVGDAIALTFSEPLGPNLSLSANHTAWKQHMDREAEYDW